MKKYIWIIIGIVIVVCFAFIWQTRTLVYRSEKYGFSFKYSATYSQRYNENTLITLVNYNNSILIDAIATENTNGYTRDISELGEGYVNLLKVFNEDYEYETLNDETITISNTKTKARRVTVKVIDGDNVHVETAVLIPATNREITIVFRGTEKEMLKKEKQIDGIINSIKLY